MSVEPFIELRNVTKRYRRGKSTTPIFDNLDLVIERGSFVAVMGPSGSGKSTLLNLLGGIDRADSGTIRVGESRLDRMSEGQLSDWRADKLGIVFQFYNLLPMLSARQNVELPLLLKPLGAKARRERADTVLSIVGLSERAGHRPGELSGGQQQRVGIARALVCDPALILCDEPTGDLDRAAADEILRLLAVLNREFGRTIVMVTHDAAAANSATRTIHLDKGVFVEREMAA